MILDEPAAHLDIGHQAMILKVIRTLASGRARCDGHSTHDPAHALQTWTTHALLVGRGSCAQLGRPKTCSPWRN